MSAEQEKIKDIAYRLWQDAGGPDGRDQEFWFAAEIQVKSSKAPAKPKAAPKAKAAAKPKAEPKAKVAAAPKAVKAKATAKV